MNDKEYFSHPALSYSKLKVLDESPPKFYRRFFIGEEEPKSDALRFGSAWDDWLTNQSEFKSKWKIKNTATTKICNCITKEEYKSLLNMALSVKRFNAFPEGDIFHGLLLRKIFELSTKQQVFITDYPNSDIQIKGKLDYFLHFKGSKNDIITYIDIKSTKAETKADAEKAFFNYKYYLQAAIYSSLIKDSLKLDYYPDGYYIFCSKTTYEVFAFKVSYDVLLYGLRERERLIEKYIDYRDNNKWFQNSECSEITLPRWLQ